MKSTSVNFCSIYLLFFFFHSSIYPCYVKYNTQRKGLVTYRSLLGLEIEFSSFKVSAGVSRSATGIPLGFTIIITMRVTVGITLGVTVRVTIICTLTMTSVITKEIPVPPPYFWKIWGRVIKNFLRVKVLSDKLHSPRIIPILFDHSVVKILICGSAIQWRFRVSDTYIHTSKFDIGISK